MASLKNARKILTSSAKVATLVCIGAAETACNLQISSYERFDSGTDGGQRDAATDASAMDGAADAQAPRDADDDADLDGGDASP